MSAPTVEAAGGVVVDETGRAAIVHRPDRGDWSLPKGHLERGEDHETAALREVREETGLSCRITRDLRARRAYHDRKGRPKRVRYFVMELLGGEFAPNAEVDVLRWIGPDECDELSYGDDVALLIEHWAR